MNKILRYSLIMVLGLFSTISFAQTETLDFAAQGYANEQEVTSLTQNGITATFINGTTTCKYFLGGTAVRMYSDGGITVSSTVGNITQIVYTFSGSYKPVDGQYSIDTGAYDLTTNIWTGSANSVTLKKVNTTSGNLRLQKIEVTYSTSSNFVAAPTIEGSSFFIGSTQVSISADAGTSVYYTTDGNDPTKTSSVYSAPFTVDATKTVKAIAYKDASASTVSSKTFTKAVESSDIADFASQSNGTVANLALANAQVLYADATNKNVYVKDATGALCFYNAGLNLTTGDILNGSVAGKLSIYNNLPEFTANTLTSVDKITKTAGAAPTPVDITVAQANSMQYVSQLVRLSGVKLDSVGSNLMAIQNGDSIQIYDSFKSLTGVKLTTPSENNNLTGILIIYKTTYEIYPLTIDGYETASISNVNGVSNLNAPIYNLTGQQVNESYKGVVIRNGKKFIQK
ncbi:MAG: FN3 associated domain-containing protein [Prevotella sp.]|nr:FN3 associated domain-containing protein [Prevotella sp.]